MMKKTTLLFVGLFFLSIAKINAQEPIIFEAESGTLGSDWQTPIPTDGSGVSYLSITTEATNSTAPADAARVATYSVTFPATASATSYKLYARVWVSALPTLGNNDSMFIANDFGGATDVLDSNLWTTINNLGIIGYTVGTDVVDAGTANPAIGGDTWKWMQISGNQYNVAATGATVSFQIGAREDGFFIDKLAFGDTTVSYTVNSLNQVKTTPVLSTTAASSITETSATLAGNVTLDGGDAVTARGIVYSLTSTNSNPEIGGTGVTQVPSGSGTGVFSESITGLTFGTPYSYKAYATNASGTSYGNTATFNTSGVTWTGATNSSLGSNLNWSTGTAPKSSDNVVISNVGISPILTYDLEINNLTINASATLTINGNGSLVVNGNLIVNGTLIINSDASNIGALLVKGTSTGNITYNKHVTYSATNAEGWHLISSPVVGETEDDIITNGSLLTNGSSLKSFATYNNSYVGASGWVYLPSSATGSLNSGKGYSVKSTESKVPFTGTVKTDDLDDYVITVGTQNSWNLMGNPFPSFISGNTNATETSVKFLNENIGQLNPSFAAIYIWNSSGLSYDVINNSSDAFYIAPGQSFFLNAKTGGGLIDIKETMLTISSHNAEAVKSSIQTPKITLKISDGNINKTTNIKYIEGTTTGLDVGYDAGVFNGTDNSFNVYSHLVDLSSEVDFTLQCLPKNNYENMIIPIGINSADGKEITFSLSASGFSADMKIFLEDKQTNTFTRLDETNSDYKISTTENLNGIGRFYLHTTNSALSLNKNKDLENISLYLLKNSTLRINGLNQERVRISIYSILGKELLNTSFIPNNVKDISLPKLTTGVYLVQLQTNEGKLNKKIILD